MNISSTANANLTRLLTNFPALRVDAKPEALVEIANKALDPQAAKEVIALARGDKSVFLAARAQVLSTELPQPPQGQKRVAVSGLSAGGLALAAMLAKMGFKVEAFESRTSYTREMQFSNRQGAVDFLSSIDPKLPARFFEIAGQLEGSMRSFDGVAVKTDATKRPRYRDGDPTLVASTADELLKPMPSGIVQCKAFEQMMHDYLAEQPNVTIHRGKVIELGEQDSEGFYAKPFGKNAKGEPGEKIDLGYRPDVFSWEGLGSAMRKATNIEAKPISPKLPFIAGQVPVGEGFGPLSRTHKRDAIKRDGTAEKLITQALKSPKLNTVWVLAGVPDAAIPNLDPVNHLDAYAAFDPKSKEADPRDVATYAKTTGYIEKRLTAPAGPLRSKERDALIEKFRDPRSTENREMRQWLIEQEFCKGATLVVDKTTKEIESSELTGPMQGSKPTLFDLQLQVSKKAIAGSNVFMGGDSNGNGSFTQGAGNMIAVALHTEMVKQYYLQTESGVDRSTARESYNTSAMAATLFWGAQSIGDFYPYVDRVKAGEVYTDVANRYLKGEIDDPQKTLDELMAKLPRDKNPVVAPPIPMSAAA